MRARLIPWCLAATGFLAALTVFTWQGKPGDPARQLQAPAAAAYWPVPAATKHPESLPAPAAAAMQQDIPQVLPLPPATRPQPDPIAQPVPDDEPTVDDLPAPRSPTEFPADE
jgi:hypothetical protein